MTTDVLNTSKEVKTILVGGELENIIELSDGKVIRITGGTAVFYQSEDHLHQNEKTEDHLEGCAIFNFTKELNKEVKYE